jgi:hypothetical protein
MTPKTTWILLLVAALAGCSAILPQSENTDVNPWTSYQEMQTMFDSIIPHKTTVEDLKALKLDPHTNPNIAILNYSDILRRFIPSPSINAHDLDLGVQECIKAKMECEGYESTRRSWRATVMETFLLISSTSNDRRTLRAGASTASC